MVRGSKPGGGGRFSAPVQTGPRTHPASYTVGTGSFPGIKRPGRGVDHPSPSSVEVKERVELYLYFPSGPSWPVLGRTLHFYLYIYQIRQLTPSSRVLLEKLSVSASPQILRVLWNPNIHYGIQNNIATSLYPGPDVPSPHPPIPFLSDPFNIILPQMSGSSTWSFPFVFPNQNSVCIFVLFFTCHTPRSSYPRPAE